LKQVKNLRDLINFKVSTIADRMATAQGDFLGDIITKEES
jgi:hypothetical protein